MPTAAQKRLISEQLRRQAAPGEPLAVVGAPQRTRITEVDAGPVVVRVLGAEEAAAASESAKAFLQQRLAAGVRRSADMLKPVRSLQPAHLVQRSQQLAQRPPRRQQQQQHPQQAQAQAQRQGQRRPGGAGGGAKPAAKRRR